MAPHSLNHLRDLAEQQDFSALKAACSFAMDESPLSAHWPLLALAQAQLGEIPAAVASIERAETLIDQLDPAARVDLAGACLVLLRVDRAIELLTAVLEQQPDHDLALARLGIAHLARHDYPQALECLEQSLALRPGRFGALLNLIFVQFQLGLMAPAETRLAQARALLAQTQTQSPEPIRQQQQQALDKLQLTLWVKEDCLAEAEQWLQQLRQQAPVEHPRAIGQYARVLAECDRHEQAEAVLRGGLQQHPYETNLIQQWVELARLQGRRGQAIGLLERLIARDEDNPTWWLQLAGACLPHFEARAQQAVDKAQALCEATAEEGTTVEHSALQSQVRLLAAQVMAAQQRYSKAEQQFRELLSETPHLPPALREMGSLCLQQGRIDEAIDYFERLKQIDPVSGTSALISASRFPEDEATLEKLDRAARHPGLEGSLRSGILFQLAAAWEKCKDYDRAFGYADKANRASKRFLNYDPKDHRNACARIRAIFSADYFTRRRDFGDPSTLPMFVVGMPRSGTTLVEQIIAGHSQIFGAGELGVIPSRIAALERWERHIGSGRAYPVCMDDVTAHLSQGMARQVLEELQGYIVEAKPEARYVVDKLPHNFEHIGFIKLLFPKAKIISVRRDPRDIAMSNYFTDYQAKHGGMGFAYDLGWIGEQLADHNLLMDHWQQCFPGEILEILYEDVVEDTEGMARRMLDYIGVNWEPQVLAFNELERPVKTASVWQVRQPIYKTSKARWMNYKAHIKPLIQSANAPIRPDPETLRLLPAPGLYTSAGSLYKQDRLDEAEYEYKKLLHHIPDHGAANYQVGVIYWRKGHLPDAIPFLQKAHQRCPWQPAWREGLIQAYEALGEMDKAAALRQPDAGHGQDTCPLQDQPEATAPQSANVSYTTHGVAFVSQRQVTNF
jgi:tetratricopeptide (TPR) repeat protein